MAVVSDRVMGLWVHPTYPALPAWALGEGVSGTLSVPDRIGSKGCRLCRGKWKVDQWTRVISGHRMQLAHR